jgi:sugar phosphate permease
MSTGPLLSGRESVSMESEVLEGAYKKVRWRLLPFIFVCYVVAYLDRVNVGFAKLTLVKEPWFSDAIFSLGAGLFFVGYFFFEVPSNVLMHKIGARKTLMRIMALWGITAACMAFINSATTFYTLRILLGIFEAGFAPGIILYFTYWFPTRMRAKILAIFLTGVAVSGVIGSPLSGAIMSGMNNLGGLSGWQWLFILEGIPAVILAIAVPLVLADRPQNAAWLSPQERAAIAKDLAMDETGRDPHSHAKFGAALRDWRLYMLSFIYFAITAGVYLISFWLPTIINALGKFSAWQTGLITAIPYSVAVVGMIAISARSDRTDERKWHCAMAGLVGSLALLSTIWSVNVFLSVALFSIATAGIFAMMPVFWAIPPKMLAGSAAAGGIAVINSIGTLSGFVSPFIVGSLKASTGTVTAGLIFMSGLLWVGILVLLKFVPGKRT